MYVLCFNTDTDYKYTAVANTLKETAEYIADHIEEYNDAFDYNKLVKKYKEVIKEQNEFELDECSEHTVFIEFYRGKKVVSTRNKN